MSTIYYIKRKRNYKYELARDHVRKVDWLKGFDIDLPYIRVTPDGEVRGKIRYRWDGASGPTIDTPSSMGASCFHDIGYQLMRMGLIPFSYRDSFDEEFRKILMEDGMWEWRANLWHIGVGDWAASHARRRKPPKILSAP